MIKVPKLKRDDAAKMLYDLMKNLHGKNYQFMSQISEPYNKDPWDNLADHKLLNHEFTPEDIRAIRDLIIEGQNLDQIDEYYDKI